MTKDDLNKLRLNWGGTFQGISYSYSSIPLQVQSTLGDEDGHTFAIKGRLEGHTISIVNSYAPHLDNENYFQNVG